MFLFFRLSYNCRGQADSGPASSDERQLKVLQFSMEN